MYYIYRNIKYSKCYQRYNFFSGSQFYNNFNDKVIIKLITTK